MTRKQEWLEAGYNELNRNNVKIGDIYYVVVIYTSIEKKEQAYLNTANDAADFAVIHLPGYFATIEQREQIAPNAAKILRIRTYLIPE